MAKVETGTGHFRRDGLSGILMMITMPFALWFGACAIPQGPQGFTDLLSNPLKAIVIWLFFTSALWYCKLQFDEVVMDYFAGKGRSFGLKANIVIASLTWLLVSYVVIKLAFLG